MVGGKVEVGVREDHGVVLGPAERLGPLARSRRPRVDVPGDRGRADEGDGCDPRVIEQGIHGHLVAVDHIEHPVWQARPRAHSSATSIDADGSRSLGFKTKVLPQAMAIGCIHMGTMTGKLNGVIPHTTPSGWRYENMSMPVETWSEYSPFKSCGIPQANSTTSRPRWTSPRASEMTLPCSSDTTAASSSTWALTSSRKANSVLALVLSEERRPLLESLRGGPDGGIDFIGGGERDLGCLLTAGRVEDGAAAARNPLHRLPAAPMPNDSH